MNRWKFVGCKSGEQGKCGITSLPKSLKSIDPFQLINAGCDDGFTSGYK